MNKLLRMALGLTVIVMAAGAFPLDAECYPYEDSMVVYVEGEAYCGGSGSGCTECVDAGGGSCVTNGQSCIRHPTQ